MQHDERDENEPEADVDAQQRPVGETYVEPEHPEQSRRERAQRGSGGEDGENSRGLPLAAVGQPPPDAGEFEPEQDGERQSADPVGPEQRPSFGCADGERRQPGGHLEADEQENRPVDEPWRWFDDTDGASERAATHDQAVGPERKNPVVDTERGDCEKPG